MRVPDVELLWWEGCPSTELALQELRQVLREAGLEAVEPRLREISSDDEAVDSGFIGSPTILVNGLDVVPAPDEAVGLTCRVYRRRDGRISPTPDPEDIRAALERAPKTEEAA